MIDIGSSASVDGYYGRLSCCGKGCLLIASGCEHSVPNMTLLSIALLAEHPPTVTLGGVAWNLLWVTIGNAVSGARIMGLGYWAASRVPPVSEPAGQLAAAE
jgi:nitrite transporter NirC